MGRLLIATWLAACCAPFAGAQSAIELLTVDPWGAPTTGEVGAPAISADGRFVAFASSAPNIVAGDTNGVQDVYVRDRLLGATERVSVADLSGAQADGRSFHPSITADGRHVAFASLATNLVANPDSNGVHDIYVRDRATGRTRLVSVVAAGHPFTGAAGSGNSYGPSISAEGRHVAFYSEAEDLLPPGGDSNGHYDAFVADLATGVVELASVDDAGAQANWHSSSIGFEDPSATAISADGRFVVYITAATNLVAGANSGLATVVWRDRLLGRTDVAARTLAGAPSLHESTYPSISDDGNVIGFYSSDPALVVEDGDALRNFFVLERATGRIERVDTSSTGVPGGSGPPTAFGLTGRMTMSRDGRIVGFNSDAPNLAPGDANGRRDVQVRDRAEHATHLVSRAPDATSGDGQSTRTAVSADGRWIAFQSGAGNLVANDANGAMDIFVARVPESATTFCAGDGGAAPCPCGNFGAWRHGCANSTDPRGARLAATGLASVAHDGVALLALGLPSNSTVVLLQSIDAAGGGHGVAFGDGLRCLAGSIVRLGTRTADATGRLAFGAGVAGDPRLSVVGALPATGGARRYQAYFRNAAAFCTSASFNLSNGLSLEWVP
ncbi:MAG: hypothetical protein ACK57N_00710 [Planctomycetia bacterium]